MIISSFIGHEVGKISRGELTCDNEGHMHKAAFFVIREATLEEYKAHIAEQGFVFYDYATHGPYYYEVQILD